MSSMEELREQANTMLHEIRPQVKDLQRVMKHWMEAEVAWVDSYCLAAETVIKHEASGLSAKANIALLTAFTQLEEIEDLTEEQRRIARDAMTAFGEAREAFLACMNKLMARHTYEVGRHVFDRAAATGE